MRFKPVNHWSLCILFFFPPFSSDDNLSEDDINECEKEDPLHENDDVPHPDYVSKKKKKMDIGMRWEGSKESCHDSHIFFLGRNEAKSGFPVFSKAVKSF